QLLFGFKRPWLPERILKLSFSRAAFEKGESRLHKPARVIDRFLGERLTVLSNGVGSRVVAFIAIILSLLTLPLEIVPYAVAIPGLALLAYGLGLTARDGYVIAAGHALALGSLGFLVSFL